MKLKFKEVKSLNEPILIDECSSPDKVYIRDCVKEGEDGYFEYKEAILSKDEYLYATCNNVDLSYAQVHYEEKLNIPVEYEENGHLYKPKWAQEIYAGLIEKGRIFPSLFPIKIWDATGLEENAEMMSLENLIALTLFLGTIQEQYFNEYKQEKM